MVRQAETTRHAVARARFIAPVCAGLAVVIACGALVNRWRDEAPVAGVDPPVMVPLVAIGILLAALALLLVRPRRGELARGLGLLAAAGTLAAGIFTLGEYLAGWGETLEEGHWLRLRPGPASGLGLVIAGTALIAFGLRRRWARRLAMGGAAATLVIAFAGLVGHAYGASVLYGLNHWGGTAVSTGLALSALALGMLFVDPARGTAGLFVSASASGYLMRRLIPAALAAPLLLGWLMLIAQGTDRVDIEFGTALLIVSLIVLLVGLIVHQAMVLHATEAERERLLARERQSRERISDILESIHDAFAAVDRDWRFTYINREAERLLRQPREELLGRSLWEKFPAVLGTVFDRQYHWAMETKQAVQFEEYYAPLEFWVDVRAFPTADGLSIYLRDVTSRRLTEEQIRQSEALNRLLVEMIPQHIWATNPDGYHTYFSRRWYEFSGTQLEQTQGQGWLEYLHPEDRKRTVKRWQHSLKTGEPYAIEYRFRGVDGEYHWFLGQAMAQRNEAGEIVRWIGTLTDISERKALEEERERLLALEQEARAEAERRRTELERVTESRARLMRGFSHDMRNPLSAADGHAWLLESGRIGALTPRQSDSVQGIRRAIRTAVRLIDDLLELARAESGQLNIQRVATDVGQAAEEVAHDFHAKATSAGLSLEVLAPHGLQADTDPARLRQILANLLSNSVKYAPHSHVTLDARRVHDGGPQPGVWVAISVTDTGPGIPADKQELIFQEYTRLEPEAQQGAGIGLAISRRIAQLMGGDLTVESEPGHGARFTLWLPPAAAEERAVATR
ncbi:ATP-binding protein [Stutzerimonas nosocomialis]|nr:ATP-binding protein [Stutzerimonas nosocomialis]